jgi:LysM domain
MTAGMDRARRSPLRFLAPVGLVVFFFAFLLVVTTADVSDGGDSNDANDQAEQRDLKDGNDRGERRRERREQRENRGRDDVYIVKEGDTLASIAEETEISVEEIQELNPNLDPQTLTTGQCVLLRDGAECPGASAPPSGSTQ